MEYYSTIKKGNPAICNNMGLEGIIPSKVSQRKTSSV